MGEREQKRLYHAPLPDSTAGQPYPWVYYLLDGSKDQLAVWHGQQSTSYLCDTVKLRNVFLYPTEYLTYGAGKQSSLITKPDGSKEYRFFDHLGSSRGVLGDSGFTFTDYAPFGELLGGGTESRKGFIDKEKDRESSLRNLGMRQYDENSSRFMSIDPLWEKFPQWSPYQYSYNNPLIIKDPEGLSGEASMEGNTITINSHIVFYSWDKDKKLLTDDVAKRAAQEIMKKWNTAGSEGFSYNGQGYKVQFNVTYEIQSHSSATAMAKENTSAVNNFIRIGTVAVDGVTTSSSMGGNSGFFNINEIGSTTYSHEWGHGFGLNHYENDRNGGGPNIMIPRGTPYHDPAHSLPDGSVNPDHRIVTGVNLKDIFGVYQKNGIMQSLQNGNKVSIGIVNNIINPQRGKK